MLQLAEGMACWGIFDFLLSKILQFHSHANNAVNLSITALCPDNNLGLSKEEKSKTADLVSQWAIHTAKCRGCELLLQVSELNTAHYLDPNKHVIGASAV